MVPLTPETLCFCDSNPRESPLKGNGRIDVEVPGTL